MKIRLKIIVDNGNIYNINRDIALEAFELTKTPDKLFEYHMNVICSEAIESLFYKKEDYV